MNFLHFGSLLIRIKLVIFIKRTLLKLKLKVTPTPTTVILNTSELQKSPVEPR